MKNFLAISFLLMIVLFSTGCQEYTSNFPDSEPDSLPVSEENSVLQPSTEKAVGYELETGEKEREGKIPVSEGEINIVAIEKLDIEVQTLLPGVQNVVITFISAEALLGAGEDDVLEILDGNTIVGEAQYVESPPAPYSAFVTPVQPYSEEEVKELMVRLRQ